MSRAYIVAKRTARFLRGLLVVALFCVIGFLVWRAFLSDSIPDEVKPLAVNESIIEAYEKDRELSDMFTQEQRTITSTEKNYGYFSVERAIFVPSANQIQVLARYNNSTLRATQEDYGLDAPPSRDGEPYDISLVLVRDLTPEDESDNLKGPAEATEEIRIHPTSSLAAQSKMYNYRLLVFELGELSLADMLDDGTLISVFADFYYAEDIDYSKDAYGTLCLYDYITEISKYKLTGQDRAALEAAAEK